MLSYSQSTGKLTGLAQDYQGYSGFGAGRNNPDMECVPTIGPLPQGIYKIGVPVEGSHLGPIAIPLAPCFSCARSGFFIHGDSATHPGQASHGCIILPRPAREAIADGGFTEIEVVK